ncbi:hypothetical protein BJV82DRAFT_612037 [Fennellomyces sp. T-0311]|nr:hypothetical protein BJV82DRAFT_612037 [Fennellomyces sp. T-0311]
MFQARSNRLFNTDTYIKILYQDTLKWIATIRESPLFNEEGREIATKHQWMNFRKEVHKLKQNRQDKMLQSTRSSMEEQGPIADVIPMEECVPDVPISSCSMSGTAMDTPNANREMHSPMAGVTTTLDFAIPVASIAKTMKSQRLALPWQEPLPPINPQVSCQLDFFSAGSSVAPSSGDSTTEVQAALSGLTISSGATSVVQTSIPHDRPNLVAERNAWQKKARVNGHRQIKSTGGGLFPCLEGCLHSSFSRARDRERHYRDVHRKHTPYICPDCNARFARKDSVGRHRKNNVCKKLKSSTV